MNLKELTDMLVESSQQYSRAKFNPWWEGNHEEAIYRYSIFSKETLKDVGAYVAECGTEELFAPVGSLGLTLFHLLVWHNFLDAVEEALQSGKVGREEIDRRDGGGHGLTAFLLACACGNAGLARLLLAHGADPAACDERGMNAYHFLVFPRVEGLEMGSSCLEHSVGQRRDIARLLTCDVNQKDLEGMTPLVRMLSREYCSSYTWPLAEVFLDKGAATDYVDEEGNTLLMMALKHRHRTAALLLMERCPEMMDIADGQGRKPIGHAAYFRDMAMYIALKEHGAVPEGDGLETFPLSQVISNAFADVHEEDKDGMSLALYLANKLVSQADLDDDDDLGEVTGILHNALVSDEEASLLEVFRDTADILTTPIHYHGQRLCLRDECLRPCYGMGTIRKLADLGVDMDRAVIRGRTPACILAGSGLGQWNEAYFEEAAALFSRESMEQLDDQGEAAVHLAAREGHLGMLQVMAEKGVDLNLAKDAPARAGMTPLHEACAAGRGDVVRLLIAAGADDTRKDVEGETPAHSALMEKRAGRQLEVKQRADVLKELRHLDIARNDGRTPLMLLGQFQKELLSIFLSRGVDVNHRDNRGRTALMLNQDKDMAKELFKAGADLNLADNEGDTALHHALREYDEDMARYLVKKGADYSRPNNDGETAMDIAVEKGFESVLEVMS